MPADRGVLGTFGAALSALGHAVGPPLFANEAFRRKAIEDFATVIHALHQATLALRP